MKLKEEEKTDLERTAKIQSNMKMMEVLTPKTKQEIWEEISKLSPNELLRKSAIGGYLDGVIAALNRGAEIDYAPKYFHTALDAAVFLGNNDIALYLLKMGATTSICTLRDSIDKESLFKELLDNFPTSTISIIILEGLLEIAVSNSFYEVGHYVQARLKKEKSTNFKL
jgi:ankyrin repeat protein